MDNIRIETEDKNLELVVCSMGTGTYSEDLSEKNKVIVFEVQLNRQFWFFKRIVNGIKYLFGKLSIFGSYVEAQLTEKFASALKEILIDTKLYDENVEMPEFEDDELLLVACECHSPEHNMLIGNIDDDTYLEFHLVHLDFRERFRNFVRYVLNPNYPTCYFDGILLGNTELSKKRLNQLLKMIKVKGD